MAVAVGTLTITTGAVGTDIVVSGLSFAPTAVYLAWSGRATDGQGEADHKFGQGILVSGSQRAYISQSDHAAANAAADAMWRSDSCVAMLTTAGALDGRASGTLTSDGFSLNIDDTFSAALRVGYICWDATQAAIIDFTEPAGTGSQNYNAGFDLNTGLDDKAVIFLGVVDAAVNTQTSDSLFMLGIAAGDTIGQAILAGESFDTPTTTQTCGYCRAGDCIAAAVADAVVSRAQLTAWLGGGNSFTLNWTTTSGTTVRHSALVMQGGNRWAVGDFTTSTGTSNQVESTPYQPTGLLFLSAARTASTAGTTTAPDERIVGAASSASNRWSAGMIDKDNVGTSDIGVAFSTSAFYINQSTATTVVQEGAADLVSMDSTPSFTWVMDDADPGAAFVGYLLTADPATTAYTLTAGQGSYALSGQTSALRSARTATAGQGSYALSGQTAGLKRGYPLAAAQGSYALSGQDSAVTAARTLPAAQGSYSLSGQAAALVYSGAGPKTLTADQGSYALTGVAAGLKAARSLAAGFGTYDLSGQDATLTPSVAAKILAASTGFYVLSGQDAGFSYVSIPSQPAAGEPASGGHGFVNEYEAYRLRKLRDERRRRKLEEEAQEIQEAVDREISLLLREQERKDEERAEFERLRGLVSKFGAVGASDLSSRAQRAYLRVMVQSNFSSLQALDREIDRMFEEEEVAALMMLLNEDD